MAGPTRDEGLVLRTIRLGETSKIVSVLSRDHGRVKLVAKGARTVGSRLGSLLEPGNELELVFYPRPGKDLWTLSDASLRRAALTGQSTLDKLSHLFAALELADRLLPEQEVLPEFVDAYTQFVDRWHGAGDEAMSALFFALELQLLERNGLGLEPEFCSDCGRDLLQETMRGGGARALFRVAEGTLVCPQCGMSGGRWLDEGALRALGRVARMAADETGEQIEILDREERREVGRLLHEHMTFHLTNYRLPRALYWLADTRSREANDGSDEERGRTP